MRSIFRRFTARFLTPALATTLALFAAGCVPLFVDGSFQTLRLVFRLDNAIPAGEATLVHSWFFPSAVEVRKNFVQVSGRLLSEDGQGLSGRVTVRAQFEAESGKKGQRITLNVNVDDDGFFKASRKVKKNIAAGDLMMVTVQPAATAIPDGAELTVCVDLVRKKRDLGSLPACVDSGGGGGGAEATLSSLQTDFFTPTCAVVACHDAGTARGELVLVAGQSFANLVNVPSAQVSDLDRVEPGDPDNSYLIKKLRGDSDIMGERMPEGGPFLTDAQIARFVAWIDDGAPNN